MADGDAYGPAMIGLIGAVLVALFTSVVTSVLTLSTIRAEHETSVRAANYADRKQVYLAMSDKLSSLQLPGGLADAVPLVPYPSTRVPPMLTKIFGPARELRLARPKF